METVPHQHPVYKIVVLGDRRVGKTSIVRFLCQDYCEHSAWTKRPQLYQSTCILDGEVFNLNIIDGTAFFHKETLDEWSAFATTTRNGRFSSVRNAAAYLLVFDVSNRASFAYVRSLREQILASVATANTDPPFIVFVGNKLDLVPTASTESQKWTHGHAKNGDKRDTRENDWATVVRKLKHRYVECSARNHWHVMALFRETVRLLTPGTQEQASSVTMNLKSIGTQQHSFARRPNEESSNSNVARRRRRHRCVIC